MGCHWSWSLFSTSSPLNSLIRSRVKQQQLTRSTETSTTQSRTLWICCWQTNKFRQWSHWIAPFWCSQGSHFRPFHKWIICILLWRLTTRHLWSKSPSTTCMDRNLENSQTSTVRVLGWRRFKAQFVVKPRLICFPKVIIAALWASIVVCLGRHTRIWWAPRLIYSYHSLPKLASKQPMSRVSSLIPTRTEPQILNQFTHTN